MASNTETMTRGHLEYIDKTEGETLDNKTLNKMAWRSMFLQGSLNSEASDPAAMATKFRETGLSWIAICQAWSTATTTRARNSLEELSTYVDAIRNEVPSAGVYIWGYPHPNQTNDFVRILIDAAEATNADGLIIDPEITYKWNNASERNRIRANAINLMGELRNIAINLNVSIGVTSYGRAQFHRNMPWNEFANGADYGMPQIYEFRRDGSATFPENYPTLCMDDWIERGFEILIPLSAAYDRTAAETVDLLSRTPTPNAAIGWFRWATADDRPGIWDTIRDYEIP